VRLTVSVGLVTRAHPAQVTAVDLLHAADAAMYWVKEHGKNGIKVAAAP
jgi:GGDEF domain-containing protein